MTVNELRIGNLIYRKGGSEIFRDGIPEIKHPDIVVEVKTIFSDNGIDGVNASWNGDRYVFDPPLWNAKPIPLTEEWLVKAGFEKTKHNNIYDKGDYSFRLDRLNLWDYSGDEGYLIAINIQHVHSIQNLYFALTGEELNFVDVK